MLCVKTCFKKIRQIADGFLRHCLHNLTMRKWLRTGLYQQQFMIHWQFKLIGWPDFITDNSNQDSIPRQISWKNWNGQDNHNGFLIYLNYKSSPFFGRFLKFSSDAMIPFKIVAVWMFFKKWIKTEMSPQKWFHLLMSIFPLHLVYIVLLRCENFHSCRKKKLHKSGKVSNGIGVNIFRSLQKELTTYFTFT